MYFLSARLKTKIIIMTCVWCCVNSKHPLQYLQNKAGTNQTLTKASNGCWLCVTVDKPSKFGTFFKPNVKPDINSA